MNETIKEVQGLKDRIDTLEKETKELRKEIEDLKKITSSMKRTVDFHHRPHGPIKKNIFGF